MAIRPEQLIILKKHLAETYVQHLPDLLQPKSADDDLKKNVDRSFAAFAVDHLCGLTPKKAAKSVVDDFDDFGIDAIYYDGGAKTLYLVQAKLKGTSAFNQAEANSFCQGIRMLIKQNYSGFNANVTGRKTEIDKAMQHCSRIEIVIAHTGDGITAHAEKAVADLIAEECGVEERLAAAAISFDATKTIAAMHSVNAYEKVDCRVTLFNYGAATEPRVAYYGTVALSQLVELHQKHDKALYEKNIRTFLGRDTPVNTAIRDTLAEEPELFQYLNNGVTALCEAIEAKNGTAKEKQFALTGVSIINGAQTVASTAGFVLDNPGHDISGSRVMLTLIKTNADGDFGKAVTRARNHQNPVQLANFAALDDEQERLRRDLAHLDIDYVYKAGRVPPGYDPNRILLSEAVQALAVLEPDPRYAVWLKKSPAVFLDTGSEPYQHIFAQSLSAFRLANAVRVYRYIRERAQVEARSNGGSEKATYKHGEYVLAFIFAKRLREAIDGHALVDGAKLKTSASTAFDDARQTLWDKVRPETTYRGPLATFRNQSHALPVIRKAMTNHYGLKDDAALKALRSKTVFGQAYQVDLFKYLASKAPQIGNVT